MGDQKKPPRGGGFELRYKRTEKITYERKSGTGRGDSRSMGKERSLARLEIISWVWYEMV